MTREELLDCLTDRPCDVCKFHTETGCSKWKCVFEEPIDENKGEWIPKQRGRFIDIVCSKCGYVGIESYSTGYEVEELDKPELIKYISKCEMNFCERCGCDMGVKNETDN